MTFKFACQHCGQHISATTADAGTHGVCPGCGNNVVVPDPAGAKRVIGVSLLALSLCVFPAFSIFVLHLGSREILPLPVLLGIEGAICGTGVIFAHAALKRSIRARFARVISIVSLVIGYLSIAAITYILAGLLTGFIVPFEHYDEPPDLKPTDSFDFTSDGKPIPNTPMPSR